MIERVLEDKKRLEEDILHLVVAFEERNNVEVAEINPSYTWSLVKDGILPHVRILHVKVCL